MSILTRDTAIVGAIAAGAVITLIAAIWIDSENSTSTKFVDGEKIARIASSSGVYAVHDNENGVVCYVAVQKQIVRSSSIAISCMPFQE